MELMIKLYTDKPSRIAIKYPKEYTAVKTYEEIISRHGKETFSLKIELARDKVHLVLQAEQTGGKITYKDVVYRTDQLKKLEMHAGQATGMQFVHIYSASNQLLIAKPFRKETFIAVSNVEVINPGYFGNVL